MIMYTESQANEFSKKELIEMLLKLQEEYADLECQYDDLDDSYGELEDDNYNLQEEIEDLEAQVEDNNTLVDMNYLKEKLELYGLKTEELWEFFDMYMRLYNN